MTPFLHRIDAWLVRGLQGLANRLKERANMDAPPVAIQTLQELENHVTSLTETLAKMKEPK